MLLALSAYLSVLNGSSYASFEGESAASFEGERAASLRFSISS